MTGLYSQLKPGIAVTVSEKVLHSSCIARIDHCCRQTLPVTKGLIFICAKNNSLIGRQKSAEACWHCKRYLHPCPQGGKKTPSRSLHA